MLKTTKSISINGTSEVIVGEIVKPVAYMNAQIPENGTPSINKSIQDKELFKLNEEEVLKDFSDFEDMVFSLM